MSSGPFLMTERLILRPPSAEDLDGWAAFCADAETTRFLGGPKSRAEAWRMLCTFSGAWTIRGFAMFSMIRRDTGEWIGRTGPWQPEGWPGTEVGWGILRAHEGKGFAQEAATASIDYAFDVLGWSDVIHTIDPENTGSIALAERLGSVNRGPTQLPEPFTEVRVDAYGQSKEQWAARKAAQS
jgi:RimJ/RimL family protein N-acetyltransferase